MTVTQIRPQAQITDESYRARVQSAITALAACGVTEAMIRKVARLDDEQWERFMQSADGITSRQLTCLSGALIQESIYLLTGDERNRIRYSPCSWMNIIRSQYPESEIRS